MSKIRTHYDILNISRNAPPEIIRSAYKVLCQKYHPDKFSTETDKAKANQIMLLLNNAYQVLSDPLQRFEYDDWLTRQESTNLDNNSQTITVSLNLKEAKKHSLSFIELIKNRLSNITRRLGVGILALCKTLLPFTILLILIFFGYALLKENSPTEEAKQMARKASLTKQDSYDTTASDTIQKELDNISDNPTKKDDSVNKERTDKANNSKPALKAPNGNPFPNRPLYVEGYPKLNMEGLSTITVDNTQNDSDIFGKLFYLDNGQPEAVRYFFIPAHGGFILRNVTKGNYDIRYKDLSDGQIAKSEPFEVQEIEDTTGTQFSELTMTLYKVSNGNMQTTPIPENEF